MKSKFTVLVAALMLSLSTLVFVGCANGNPIETAGESTIIETVKTSPDKMNATDVAYAYLGKQKQFGSYKMETSGTTKAEKGFIKYEQALYSTTLKNGNEYFQQSQSNSDFVKMSHQSFAKGDKIVYRNALSGNLNVSAKKAYKEVYGISPDDVALGGYIMNAKSIKFAEKTAEKDGILTYRFVLDGKEAGNNAVRQMKEFGGLNGYPVFESLTLYLTLKNDWTPVTLVVESKYNISINVLGNLSCTQKITSTFSKINEKVDIPDTVAFNEKIGSTPTTVQPGQTETSPFMTIAEAFANQDYATGMHFGVDVSLDFWNSMTIESDIYVKYDKNAVDSGNYLQALNFRWDIDFSQISPIFSLISMAQPLPDILLQMNKVSICYFGDGNLYIAVSDTENVIKIETINLGDVITSIMQGTDANALQNIDISEMVANLGKMFDITETPDGITMKLKPTFIAQINAVYDKLVEDLSKENPMAAILKGLVCAKFDSVEIKTSNAAGKLSSISLLVTGTKLDSDSPTDILSVKVSIEGKLTDELDGVDESINSVLADDFVAAQFRNKLAVYIEDMWFDESYLARVNSLKLQYEKLTDAQKALVSNACKVESGLNGITKTYFWEYLAEDYNNRKDAADAFSAKLTSISSWQESDWVEAAELFANFNNGQLEYIGDEKIKTYLDAVAEHESEQV